MDRFEIAALRDFYGALLTKRQDEMLRMRYDEDLSFGEIAEVCQVSRQAVLDSINKGEKHLAEYENALGLMDKHRRMSAIIEAVLSDGKNSEARGQGSANALMQIKSILEE